MILNGESENGGQNISTYVYPVRDVILQLERVVIKLLYDTAAGEQRVRDDFDEPAFRLVLNIMITLQEIYVAVYKSRELSRSMFMTPSQNVFVSIPRFLPVSVHHVITKCGPVKN